jgi:DNA-binding response OmpR family regulator
MDNEKIKINILLIDDNEADVKKIKAHLDEWMRLPWSLIHCNNIKEATSRIRKADIIVLDLGLEGLITPKEIFENIDHIAIETPIIALTGKGEDEHDLATLLMEKGAADVIVRGKFRGLVDAIEFALIRQKIATSTRESSDKALQESTDLRIKDKAESKQILSMFVGDYSVVKNNKDKPSDDSH